MIDVGVSTKGFEIALSEFSHLTRKDLNDTFRQQCGTLIGHLIALTPPAGGSGQAMSESGGVELAARNRGAKQIAADIVRIFPTTKAPEGEVRGWIAAGLKVDAPSGGSRKIQPRGTAFSLAEMRTYHRAARNPKSGRTRIGGGVFTAFTRANLLRQYIAQEQKKVGILSAGWLAAAETLRTAKRMTPAWITRHGRKPGGAEVRENIAGLAIRMHNDQGWFPGDMSRRVMLALDRRERGLKKAAEAILERRARQAQKRQES